VDNAAMEAKPPKADPPKRKRRWFQFSLRTLMTFTAICAIASAWLGKRIEQKRKERESVAAIVKLGGIVRYDYQCDPSRIGFPNAEPPGPHWLRNLLGENFFSEVVHVVFNNRSNVRDDGLVHLNGLTGMRMLMLSEVNVTDAGLVNLNGLVRLSYLDLSRTKTTDAGLDRLNLKGLTQLNALILGDTDIGDSGLAHVKGMTRLETLTVQNTHVTDVGLEHLEGLAKLQTLDLAGTNVTDAGLIHLRRLTKLQTLDLALTKVTRAGVKDLQKALPNCEINFWHNDEPHRPNLSESAPGPAE
jgi:hypothetical protein